MNRKYAVKCLGIVNEVSLILMKPSHSIVTLYNTWQKN